MTMMKNNNLNFLCIVCGNKNFKFLFSDKDRYVKSTKKIFSIFKCQNCNLIQVDPKINESEFDIYYPHQYDPYQSKPVKKTFIQKSYGILDSFLKLDKVKFELTKFKELNKKYLDYGSGSGRHLNHVRELYPKWKLYGYDKSKYAKENLKKNNFESIENIENLPDDFFDIINLSSVIEHLEFPEQTIQLLNDAGTGLLYSTSSFKRPLK